jgi:hypothetical protein
MLEAQPIKATVELQPGPGPISGRVGYPSGEEEPFAGWLELSTTLEQARHNGTPRGDAPPDDNEKS